MSRRLNRKSPYGILSRVGLFGLMTESLGFAYLAAAAHTTTGPDAGAILLAALGAILGQYLMMHGSGWGLRACSGFVNTLLAGLAILMAPFSTLQPFLLAAIFFLIGYFVRHLTDYWRIGHFPPGRRPFFNLRDKKR